MLGLNSTMERVTKLLRGLTPTARLLIGALAIIMALSLAIVAMFAGKSELVPLGLPSAGPEAKANAVNYLNGQNIPVRERGNDLLVPAEQRIAILAQLTERELITSDQISFATIVQDDNPFTGQSTRRRRYLVAKMNEVASMISQMTGIEKATVVIDEPEGMGGIGAARIEASASVNVLTTQGALTRGQADAVARIVSGAHASLKIENVTVIDARSNRRVTVHTDDGLGATEHLEHQRATERHVSGKIESLLAYIPGVIVQVTAQVDGSEVVTRRFGVEDPKHGVTEERNRERNASNRPVGGEPGVRANTGDALDLSAGRSSSLSDTENSTRTIPAFPTEDTSIRKDRGVALKINAAVNVPLSWFMSIYRAGQDDEAAEPDDTALQTLVALETEKIRAGIAPLIETDAWEGALPGTVVVTMFNDIAVAGGVGSGGWTDSTVGSMLVSDGTFRSVGLGALALVSLLFMFMIVRKASHEEEMPTAEELVGIPPALSDEDLDLVGEADESVAAMEGVEIDEDAVRRQQMLEQINDLALNSSDEAATLIRKWIKNE